MSKQNQHKPNVPELRFPEFSGEWEEFTLGEKTSLLKDGTHGTHKDVTCGPWLLSAKNIKNNKVYIDESDRKISIEDYNRIYKNYSLEVNDILLSIVGTIGRLALVKNNKNIAFQRSVAIIRMNDEIKSDFLIFLMQAKKFQNELKKKQVVSAQPGIYLGDLAKIKINYPNIEEQQKISDFFSKLDRQIELEEEKLALLEEQKKGYMQKIFSQELRFKDENGNEYPVWEEKKLGEISKKITEKNNDIINRNVLTNSAELGVIKQTDYFDKNIANINNLSGYYVIRKNSFVYNPRISKHAPFGPINRNKLGKIGVISPLYFAFEVSGVDYCFMEHYFKSDKWHRFMYENGDSGARSDRFSIKNSDFMNMMLYIPDIREQISIGAFFEKLTKLINKQQNKVSALIQLKRALLRKIFV